MIVFNFCVECVGGGGEGGVETLEALNPVDPPRIGKNEKKTRKHHVLQLPSLTAMTAGPGPRPSAAHSGHSSSPPECIPCVLHTRNEQNCAMTSAKDWSGTKIRRFQGG